MKVRGLRAAMDLPRIPKTCIGVRIRGALGDIDPLNQVPFKTAISRVKKGPLLGVSLILPRTTVTILSSTGSLYGL